VICAPEMSPSKQITLLPQSKGQRRANQSNNMIGDQPVPIQNQRKCAEKFGEKDIFHIFLSS